MTRNWIVTAVALIGVVPMGLAGQTPRPPRPAPAPRPDGRAYTFSFNGNRGRIGVLVNSVADSASDKYGARIDGVTPGGPADKAGLKAGDIITKFNGTSLARASASNDDDDESRPGSKLVELAHALDPGDTVRVEYRRGSDTKTATLVADEQSYAFSGEMPRVREFELPRTPVPFMMGDGDGMGMGMGMSFCMGDAWCDLDLVTLNADLGDYFGTKDGVLVIKAPADSGLPLKSGDVILSIGGRKPTSPAHAMRILRSYDAGETVSIELMRHQKRQTLSWTVPEADRGWRRSRTPRPKGEQSMWIAPDQSEHLRAMQEDAERALIDAQGRTRQSVRDMRQQAEELQRRLQEMLRRQQIQTREIRRTPVSVVI